MHIGKSIRIDSQGFSVIIGLHKDCAAKGRAFAVKTASRDALRLFRMMSLDRFIHLEEAADDD